MSEVLFVSQNPLGRCENLTAVWDMYGGGKSFRHGVDGMRSAEKDGFDAVVCDCLPAFIEGKGRTVSINICHAVTGNKYYGLHEGFDWYDRDAFAQTDIATAASEQSIGIVAGQLGIPESRIAVTGLPRTDICFGTSKGDGGTVLAEKRAYLYIPTFRNPDLGGWLPRIDWAKLDSMLGDDEVIAVKRHYFTEKPLLDKVLGHIVELDPNEPSMQYMVDCDVLVSDYSSAIFDGYLMGKPSVLTTDDMDDYLRDRPMYYEFPGFYGSRYCIAEGNEERLLDSMRDAAENGMGEADIACMEAVAGACDGHSTERVCELIENVLEAM